jgi:hypothetical protein
VIAKSERRKGRSDRNVEPALSWFRWVVGCARLSAETVVRRALGRLIALECERPSYWKGATYSGGAAELLCRPYRRQVPSSRRASTCAAPNTTATATSIASSDASAVRFIRAKALVFTSVIAGSQRAWLNAAQLV